MKNFFAYFFGQGDTVEFNNFSLAHLLPIVVMIIIILLIIKYGKKLKGYKHEERIRITMAFIMLVCEMSYFWRLTNVPGLNPNPVDHLPITVCGWALIFCSMLLLSKNKTFFEIAYFWVFTGSIFGLLTPTVITYCGPTRFRYYQFWIEHTMGFIALFYMMFVHDMRPNVKSMIKSLSALSVLAVIAIYVNYLLPGANYLFLAKVEDTASILNILPTNFFLRLLVMATTILILFGVTYLPWYLKDRKEKITKDVMKENV